MGNLISALGDSVGRSCRPFPPSRKRKLCCIETPWSAFPLTQRHVPEERNSPNILSIFQNFGRSKASAHVWIPVWRLIIFCSFTVRIFLVHVKSRSWKLTPYRLSAAAYSIRSSEYNGDSQYVLFMKADISSSWGIRSYLKIPSSCNRLNTRQYSAHACLGMSSKTVLKTAVQVEISSAVYSMHGMGSPL